MAVLEIDGIGRVEVGADFLKLPPDRQAAEVDAIAAQIKPSATAAPAPAPSPAPAVAKASAAPAATGGDELKARGAILPIGVTQEGKLTPALPQFLEGPRQTIVDMLSGKKTVEDLTGEEIFNLGALFAGVSSAGGTGAGIARSSAERTAAKTAAETAAPVAEGAAAPAAEAAVAPAAAATASPIAANAPPPAAGFVRFYHGGQPETLSGGGGRWVTPDPAYAQGYAGPTGKVFYVDIPEASPLLRKSFDDTGTSQRAPFVSFEAPEQIAKNLKPLEAGTPSAAAVTVTESSQRGRQQGRFVDFEMQGAGKLTTKVEDGGLTVAEGSVFVNPERRGEGNAVALYERAVNWAADNGLKFRSDFTVEPEAVQVYRALERRGYPVKEQTATRAQPRFEVGPKPSEVAPAPAAAPAIRGGLHSTPETLALRGEAKAGFKALDDSNIVVNPKSFKPLTQEIFSDAALKGLDETITPSSVAVIKRLNAVADEPITLQSLNTLREVAGGAAGSKVAKDAMIAERIIDKLDDFMGSLKSKDLMLGSEADASAVAQAVNAARKTWAEMSKLEVVSRLVQRAQDSVAQRPQLGLENVLRNEFTALAKNERQMAKFTPEERNAVRQITRGATKAFMRGLGRGAPRGSVSAFTSGGIGGTISAAMGLGPIPGAVAAFGIGEAGRKLATVLTQRSVKNLENVIKSGRNEMAERAIERGRSLGEQLRGSLGTAATAKAATDRREKR